MRTVLVVCILVLVPALLPGQAEAQDRSRLTGAFDPQEVVTELVASWKRDDVRRYMDCLADSFLFVPDLSARIAYPEVDWPRYGLGRERAFFDATRGSLELVEILEKGLEVRNQAAWEVIYRLRTSEGSSVGRATFIFAEIEQRWYLLQWIDTAAEQDPDTKQQLPTSGHLRGRPWVQSLRER